MEVSQEATARRERGERLAEALGLCELSQGIAEAFGGERRDDDSWAVYECALAGAPEEGVRLAMQRGDVRAAWSVVELFPECRESRWAREARSQWERAQAALRGVREWLDDRRSLRLWKERQRAGQAACEAAQELQGSGEKLLAYCDAALQFGSLGAIRWFINNVGDSHPFSRLTPRPPYYAEARALRERHPLLMAYWNLAPMPMVLTHLDDGMFARDPALFWETMLSRLRNGCSRCLAWMAEATRSETKRGWGLSLFDAVRCLELAISCVDQTAYWEKCLARMLRGAPEAIVPWGRFYPPSAYSFSKMPGALQRALREAALVCNRFGCPRDVRELVLFYVATRGVWTPLSLEEEDAFLCDMFG